MAGGTWDDEMQRRKEEECFLSSGCSVFCMCEALPIVAECGFF